MKVRIVCYEGEKWILGKFASKLNENLSLLGVDCSIGGEPSAEADVNHHIIYIDFKGKRTSKIETLMITHVDTKMKLSQLIAQQNVYDKGICMSRETIDKLQKAGIESSKLAFINPAHDELIKPRKLTIGITSKTHTDGRKKEDTLITICKNISNQDFAFKIMGSGWTEIINEMRKMGFEVDYFEEFNYNIYVDLIRNLDYYLYFSFDEGSMGFVDAVAAGVKTIVSPQGYHLDAPNAITHAVNNETDVISVLNDISKQRALYTSSVADWTWKQYAEKHLELWTELLSSNDSREKNVPTTIHNPLQYLYRTKSFLKSLIKR
jgi:hypothetical protein